MEKERLYSRRSRIYRPLFVMVITLGCSLAVAQGPVAVYRGDPKYPGARAAALGEAISADNWDIESMFSNPASLGTIRFPGIIADHRYDWDLGVYDESLGLQIISGRIHSLGIAARFTHAGIVNAKSLDFRQLSADIGYSYEIMTDLNLGILAGIRQGRTNERNLTGSSVTLGLLYTPTAAVSYGLVIHDLGKSIEYTLQNPEGPTSMGLDEAHASSVEFSSQIRYPSRSRLPFLQLLVAVENDYIVNEFRYKGGLEFLLFKDVLALRVGLINATLRQMSYGLGLKLGRVQIDYAIMPRKEAPRFYQLTLKALF